MEEEYIMLNKIIHFSLNNRVIVLVAALLLLLGGTYTAKQMEIDVFPDLNAPTVVVMTEANGMAAEEVERLVSFPIETVVNGATNVRRVRSSSTTGFSVVWVEFEWGMDINNARQTVTEKLATLDNELPTNVGAPTLAPQASVMGEVMIVGLSSSTISLLDLRTIADWTIRPRLLSTGGVAQVAVIGGDIKEYQLLLDPGRMRHYGISLDETLAAVRNMNQNVSGGIIYEYGNEYIVRGVLQTNNTEELGKTLISRKGEIPILLSDIADIRIGAKEPRLGLASEKGRHAVLLTVTKQPNTNTIELTDKLDTAIADLRKSLPADIKISTDIFRQERFINSSIHNVQRSLYEGAFFVVIVLFIFLMNGRTTFISLMALPLSLLASIISLKMMGLTINTMSLGGMAIAIGSLVDDAIIDVENVFKRLRENKQKPASERMDTLSIVFEASKEVRMPILNSTLIIIACFVPLFFLSGMEGRMLIPLGIAFITASFASTIVALTVTPVLCSYLLTNNKENKEEREPKLVLWLKDKYEHSLQWALSNQKKVFGVTGILLVSAIITFFFLGRNFLPPFNEGSFTIVANSMPGISLEESDKLAMQAELVLMSIPEIQTVGRRTGRAELDEHSFGVNTSEFEAPFTLSGRSKEVLIAEVRHKLGAIPGLSVEVGQPISHRLDHMLSGTKANIAVKLFGTDLNELYVVGNRIKNAINDIEGIADLSIEQQIERPTLKIQPKRELMAKYGITIPEFSEIISTMLSGEVVSQVYEDGKRFDLTVKVADQYKDMAEKIKNITIDADGQKIPMSYIAEITSSAGPNTISRENVQRNIVISANVAGRDLRGVVNDIQRTIDENIKLPEGYHIKYGGQFENEQAASRTLLIASLFAILAIFLLLQGQFRNAKHSAVVLLNLPLSLIGGIYTVSFTTGEICIPSIIGFISLFGIATRNGILLMSHYNDLQQQNYTLMQRIVQGSLDRLNPILMTALCSALALIPLAIQGNLPGNEIQSPMAKVILGGLFTSTLLNMYIIPIMYGILNRKEITNTV